MDYGLIIIATAVAVILVQRADAFEDLLRAAAQRLRAKLKPGPGPEHQAPMVREGGSRPVVVPIDEPEEQLAIGHGNSADFGSN